MNGGVAAALCLSPAFILHCVAKKSDKEMLLEVNALAHELQHLLDNYGAVATQLATLSATWSDTLACTHAQPLLTAVLPLLAQARDGCLAMEHRLVTRLRAVEASLRPFVERLLFTAAVNVEAASDVDAVKPLLAAQRRTFAAIATLLARRLTVLCVEGGDTSGMGVSLNEYAREQHWGEMLFCDAVAPSPQGSFDQPFGTVLTPMAAAAEAAAAAAAAAAQKEGRDNGAGGDDDDITSVPHKRQRCTSTPQGGRRLFTSTADVAE